MSIRVFLAGPTALSVMVLAMLCARAGAMTETPSDAHALARIAALHRQDIRATLRSDPYELADLWNVDGVLLGDGDAPVIGKAALLRAYKAGSSRVLSYRPHIESVSVSGGSAVEWGIFDVLFLDRDSRTQTRLHARFLRTMKREENGTWRFTSVMWQALKSD
jgi:hypothetical protein